MLSKAKTSSGKLTESDSDALVCLLLADDIWTRSDCNELEFEQIPAKAPPNTCHAGPRRNDFNLVKTVTVFEPYRQMKVIEVELYHFFCVCASCAL